MTNRSVLLKADGLLLNHYINRLPLTLEELERIAHDMDWLLDTYQEATGFISKAGIADFVKEHKAFATIYDGQTVILYDGQLPYSEKLQYICHEMGHIVLQHTTENGVVGLCDDPKRMVAQEEEADAFAAEMMAPACVMHERGITDIEGLIKTHFLSREQAVRHAENLARQPDTEEERKLCATINHREKNDKGKYTALRAATFVIVSVFLMLSMLKSLIGISPESDTSQVISIPATSSANSSKPSSSSRADSTTLPPIVEETPEESSTEPSENAVYVTTKGKKYHKPDCYHIAGKANIIKLTIEEAEQSGYEPCKDCF